ncbi:MAG: hypothetical protein K6E79_07610 [Pseudobutyrivibrio sp.]|nr:hypothetical protein [Pseudobutyrivibrio sp.]
MDYSAIFCKYLVISYLLYIVAVIWTIFLCISEVPFMMEERIRISENYNKIKISVRSIVVIVMIFITFYTIIPIIKDTPSCIEKNYVESNGSAYQEVVDGGALGLFKSIIVIHENEKIEYRVLWADKDIKKGNRVKVTYLTNTKWAIVEKVN